MRVIAGDIRGRLLKSPPAGITRPTTDRVREALFNLLSSSVATAEAVLDVYAGSGALGIEALSRGAARADFVESHRGACAVIRENLARTGLTARGRVLCRPVVRAIADLQPPYDIILADPPYADATRENTLAALADADLLSNHGLLVVEHSRHHPVAPTYGRLARLRDRQYGDTVISIFHTGEQP